MKITDEEREAIKALIGNCDGYLTDHILSQTMDKPTMERAEKTLLYLYNRIIREEENQTK